MVDVLLYGKGRNVFRGEDGKYWILNMYSYAFPSVLCLLTYFIIDPAPPAPPPHQLLFA
jgi:hypothetical protein